MGETSSVRPRCRAACPNEATDDKHPTRKRPPDETTRQTRTGPEGPRPKQTQATKTYGATWRTGCHTQRNTRKVGSRCERQSATAANTPRTSWPNSLHATIGRSAPYKTRSGSALPSWQNSQKDDRHKKNAKANGTGSRSGPRPPSRQAALQSCAKKTQRKCTWRIIWGRAPRSESSRNKTKGRCMGKLQATKNKRHSVTQAKQAKGAETHKQ